MNEIIQNNIYENIVKLLNEARKNVKKVIDTSMVYTYFEKSIVKNNRICNEYRYGLINNNSIKL